MSQALVQLLGKTAEQTLEVLFAVPGLGTAGQPGAHELRCGRAEYESGPGVVFPRQAIGMIADYDGVLGCRDDTVGQRGDVTGEAVDELVELVGGDGSVDPAVPLGCLGVHQVGAEHDLQGTVTADALGEVLRGAAAGDDAHEGFDLTEPGLADRRERHVRGHDELGSAAARLACDLVHYVRIDKRRGVKIRGLWYDDADVLRDYRGELSTRGGKHKGKWLIRRDPRDRRQVFFQDPISHAWHPLPWTGVPRAGQMPAFGDARASALLAKAAAAGLKPKSDAELLPVLLELIGSNIPVSKWPTQMKKSQRTEHAREMHQARAAQADRPPSPPAPADAVPAPAAGEETATVLSWPGRARQTQEAVAGERRRRREAVRPAPVPPPELGHSFRARSVFVPPEDDLEEDRGGPDDAG